MAHQPNQRGGMLAAQNTYSQARLLFVTQGHTTRPQPHAALCEYGGGIAVLRAQAISNLLRWPLLHPEKERS